MTNNTNVDMAAAAYAEAVTNNSGYGIAARYAAYALADLVDGNMTQADAAIIVADAATAVLTARTGGKASKCGSNKIVQLSLAFEATVEAGFTADDHAVIGAVYRARVGKVDGGAKRVTATLQALKGADATEAVQALEALTRAPGKPKSGPTLEAVQRTIDAWLEADWSDADRKALAGILATAAESSAATAAE